MKSIPDEIIDLGEIDLDVRGRYVYIKKERFTIRKRIDGKNRSFGSYASLKDANMAKAILTYFDWNISDLKHIFKINGFYTIAIKNKSGIAFLAESETPDKIRFLWDDAISSFESKKAKPKKRESTNISIINGKYSIVKMIDGETIIFGYYEYLEDAQFVRSILSENGWDMDYFKDNNIFKRLDVFYLLKTIHGKIRLLGVFPSIEEARENADSLIEQATEYYHRSTESDYGKYIYRKYNRFLVQKSHKGKIRIFGRFETQVQAKIVRDLLMGFGWDISMINRKGSIFHINDAYHLIFEYGGHIHYLGEFSDSDSARLEKDDLISNLISDIENPSNPQNRARRKNIWTVKDGFEVFRKFDGNMVSYGVYPTVEEAVEARDALEAQGWPRKWDEDSLMNDLNADNELNDIIFSLTPWQKVVFDSIESLGKKTFTIDDLKQFESNFKRFAPAGKIESRVLKNLSDLCDLNLIEKTDGETYERLW